MIDWVASSRNAGKKCASTSTASCWPAHVIRDGKASSHAAGLDRAAQSPRYMLPNAGFRPSTPSFPPWAAARGMACCHAPDPAPLSPVAGDRLAWPRYLPSAAITRAVPFWDRPGAPPIARAPFRTHYVSPARHQTQCRLIGCSHGQTWTHRRQRCRHNRSWRSLGAREPGLAPICRRQKAQGAGGLSNSFRYLRKSERVLMTRALWASRVLP